MTDKILYYGAIVGVTAGLVLLVLTRIHHLIINTHLTESQAFVYYLPFWIIGGILIVIGVFIIRVTGQSSAK